MGAKNFPLRWESTGDQWWYASPIDWAAANGHYDLVREMIKMDNNHLFKLTSLRRIRRLESVWDDDQLFDDVSHCRCTVARKLFDECETNNNSNTLFRAGYGGWLLYTAASAGDLGFIEHLVQRNPLLVFGEGEYGVTDILYAAARSKNSDAFRLIYKLASTAKDWEGDYKLEMMNRGVHAAARGGNLIILKELLSNCTSCVVDVLALRDKHGSTILHAAAARGQLQVAKDVIESFDLIDSTDNQGNTALHIAAYRGQLEVVEALILACPSLISLTNNSGETFLHTTVSGFHNPAFTRLDRQMELMKQLLSGQVFSVQDIINAKNSGGRTALHMAIIGNVQSQLMELLLRAESIDVNIRDADSMTALDLLKQRPRSPSSDILIRHLISAGATFGSREYSRTTRVIASHIRMQSNGASPGTWFRMSDAELFSCTDIKIPSYGNPANSSSSTHVSEGHSVTDETHDSSIGKKPASVIDSYESKKSRLKSVLLWPRVKEKKAAGSLKKPSDGGYDVLSCKLVNNVHGTPVPLRQRFAKPLSLSNNRRTLAVRSKQSSPIARKKFSSELAHGVLHVMPSLNVIEKQGSASTKKKLRSQYFCFGGSSASLSGKTRVSRQLNVY